MRATCPKCEERIEFDATPNRMVSVTCPTCTYQFYTKSPKTIAGSGAASAEVPPAITQKTSEDELKLSPETPPSRYQGPPSLPKSVASEKFSLANWMRSAGSWVIVIGLIVAFGALGLSVILFAPQFVEVAGNLPAPNLPAPNLFPTPVSPQSASSGTASSSGNQWDTHKANRKVGASGNSASNRDAAPPRESGGLSGFFFPRRRKPESAGVTDSIVADDLLQEYIELQEQMIGQRQKFSAYGTWEINEYWKFLEGADLQSKALLERALELRSCPDSIAGKHRVRLKSVAAKVQAFATTEMDALTPPQQAAMRRAFSDQAILERVPHVRLLQQLIERGFGSLSDADFKQEPVLSKQIQLFRELNAALAEIDSTTDLSLVSPRLESAADEMIELAAKLSEGPTSQPSVRSKLDLCAETQRMVAFRILRISEQQFAAPRAFANAALNFYAADELYGVARNFSADELRKKMSDARRQQQGFAPQAIPSLASTMRSGSYWAKTGPVASQAGTSQAGTLKNSARSKLSAGPPALFERLTPSVSNSPSLPTQSFPDRRGPTNGFGNRPSRPPFSGPLTVPFSSSARGMQNVNRNRYAGANGARIFFAKPVDPSETAKRWVKELGVSGWSMTTSGGQCELSIPWRESMESLAQKFGRDKVVEVDSSQRWIRVLPTE